VAQVRPASGPEEVSAALRLRERVFFGEQGVRVDADRDGRDGDATHIVAVQDGEVVGTCRLVFDGSIARLGRMAVERGLRGNGLGAALLEEAERCARDAGSRRIDLHAQTPAIPLYSRGGYVQRGETFYEEGLPHVSMDKSLEP
jgi:predicted GNAT family N-acyltransferase